MFNLNIPAASLLNVDSGGGICTTPKTPEIVNTLIAMTTNPMDNYSFTTSTNDQSTTISPANTTIATTTTGINQQQSTINNNNNNSNNQQLMSQSQDSSHSSCSGSSLDSPAGTNSTPSVQQTCSQFIKAGLKITIQNKRKMSSCDSSSGTEQGTTKSKYARKSITGDTSEEDTIDNRKSLKTGLTPEDEDRRRRRRERNKIAATKCRMKKRERTQNLINESEQLETQNIDMKSQVRNLEMERRQLFDMLQSHSSSCIRPGGYQPSSTLCQSPAYKYLQELGFCDSPPQQQQQQQQQSQQQDLQQQQIQKDQPQISPSQRQPIPSMSTIKFSRNNGLIQQQPSITTTVDLLPNGYCKPSPTTHELGYLNSPSNQDLTVCLTNTPSSQHQQHHLHQNGNGASSHTAALLKSDYIPNCENTDGSANCGTLPVVDTCTTTADFVLKNELVDTHSPYTTAQSAERFLFETNCENFDIKHTTNNLNNNNTNNNNNTSSHNNINTIVDFHTQLIATPVSCQPSYDSLLIKNDFLTTDTELLAQLTDAADAEFTDLDSGVTAYSHMTNGGCLA